MSKVTDISIKAEQEKAENKARIMANHVNNIITEGNVLSDRVGRESAARGMVHASSRWLVWYISGGAQLPPEYQGLVNAAVTRTIMDEVSKYAEKLELLEG